MNPRLALELFGYLGTALVLVSMLMTDIKWLRAINMIGGFIGLIYAILVNTMPVVVLNVSMLIINGVQLARAIISERKAKGMSAEPSAYNEEEAKKEEHI